MEQRERSIEETQANGNLPDVSPVIHHVFREMATIQAGGGNFLYDQSLTPEEMSAVRHHLRQHNPGLSKRLVMRPDFESEDGVVGTLFVVSDKSKHIPNTSYRNPEDAAAEQVVGPGVQAGALKVLQNLAYIKRGKPYGHVFDCELGSEERRFVRQRIQNGDRSAGVTFERIEENGEFYTQVTVVKRGRR